MGFLKEFKEFAVKGNVMDMAVGVIIGGAFGKIVTSLVNDVIMPPIGLVVGGVDFTDLSFTMKKAVLDAAGQVVTPAVTWNYGAFIQQIVDFTILAFCVFLMVKVMNKINKKKAEHFGDIHRTYEDGERIVTTPPYTAYLKIAEGCSNGCAFCIIPKLRGKYRSRTVAALVEEAKKLVGDLDLF